MCRSVACELGVDQTSRGGTYDHEHEVGKAGFEKHFSSDVLDEQVHSVDGEVNTGVEGEKLEDLGVQVDLCREVLDLDVDFADVH